VSDARPLRPIPPQAGRTTRWLDVAVKVAAGLALVSICLEYGFDAPPFPVGMLLGFQFAAVALFIVQVIHRLMVSPKRLGTVRRHALDVGLIFAGLLVVLLVFEFSDYPVLRAAAICIVAMQVLLLGRLGVAGFRFHLELSQSRLRPTTVLVLSFVVLILVGGLLLSLPKAMAPEHRHDEGRYEAERILNCFFTSASAVCVTGLVVYDTGADFSFFGQAVILVLIQLGGLGIMIFGSLFGMLIGRQLSLRQSLVLQDAMSYRTIGHVRQMVWFIVALTFTSELIGAVLLYGTWGAEAASVWDRLFRSVFHSVSAFCNAGFALQGDNLVRYAGAWQVYVAIMPLIVIGGLGFPVTHDLYAWLRGRLKGWMATLVKPKAGPIAARSNPRIRYRFSLHSKLVLWSTVILIVLPALAMLVFESAPKWRTRGQIETAAFRAQAEGRVSTMSDLPFSGRVAAALFQSVTTRTAGFNTVHTDVHSLSPASRFLMCLLMFIGGSPASTAGGVKTVGIALLVLGVYSTLRGRQRVECFGRTIPDLLMRRAAALFTVMAAAVALTTLVLCYTESAALPRILFEAVSAFGTVGLSTGLTDELTVIGRVVIILAMFVGRLGPLTVLITLAGQQKPARYAYPEEQPVIG